MNGINIDMFRNKYTERLFFVIAAAVTAALVLFISLVLTSNIGYAEPAGEMLFEQECVDCHYSDDFSDYPQSEVAAMLKAIVNGEADHMQELNFTDEEIEYLANYLSSIEVAE